MLKLDPTHSLAAASQMGAWREEACTVAALLCVMLGTRSHTQPVACRTPCSDKGPGPVLVLEGRGGTQPVGEHLVRDVRRTGLWVLWPHHQGLSPESYSPAPPSGRSHQL